MLHVGIDFGTTNTTIAFFETGQIDSTKPQTYKNANNNTDYIPSYVAIEKNNSSSYEIGESAKSKLNDNEYHVFNRFKMLLSEDDQTLIQRYGLYDEENSPKEIAKKYLKGLLNQFAKDHHKKIENIKKLVITVPEIWLADKFQYYAKGKQSQQRIFEICTEIGLPKPKLVSEPAGAVSYFTTQYHKEHKKYFKGHVLVCDCGGGTIDFSLATVERKQNETEITVIAREGIGHNQNNQLGSAGVAYDEAVIKHLRNKSKTTTEQKNYIDHCFSQVLNEFEKQKITHTDLIDKAYKNYCEDDSADKKLFSLYTPTGELKVFVSDLATVFNQVIHPVLTDTLKKLQKSCQNNQVDSEIGQGDVFKVLMVGGFSRFALVQRTIKQFFNSDFDEDHDDPRFNHAVPNTEIHLAIAYGASLYAKNITTLKTLVPLDICLSTSNRDVALVKNKSLTTDYAIPNYKNAPSIKLSLLRSHLTKPIALKLIRENYPAFSIEVSNIQESFPNPTDGAFYAIAISIDDNELYYLHAKQVNSNTQQLLDDEKITPLGDVLAHATGLVVID